MSRTQFTLIERPEYHPTAVSREVLADMLANAEPITAQRPVTKAEIKRDRIHVLDDQFYFEQKAFAAWKARVDGKTFKATVHWFDSNRGVGGVTVPELEKTFVIYACNISGKKTWYEETACVFYERGQEIEVRLEVFYGGGTFVIGLTPGTLDADKWNSLDHSRLAFRCNEQGEAVNGLFG